MKKAMMIGAGNIGRGFIGQLLENAGFHVVFADVNPDVIREINRRQGYTVHIMDEQCTDIPVSNISGIEFDGAGWTEEFKDCDLVATAVGLSALPKAAHGIAKGIVARKAVGCDVPLNVIACENAVRATTILKRAVYRHLSPSEQQYCEQYVGFPDCTVDRIVPAVKCNHPIDVAVERHFEWILDNNGIRGVVPPIPGMTLAENLQAYIERKLYLLNCGHAISAYLGYQKGYETIREAIQNPEINGMVKGALLESGRFLNRKFGFNPSEQALYVDSVLKRFMNPYLADGITRVARDPIRKLSPDDRLVKPAVSAMSNGYDVPHLMIGIVAALCYDNPADEQSCTLQSMLTRSGVENTLKQISGIDSIEPIAVDIAMVYKTAHFFSGRI